MLLTIGLIPVAVVAALAIAVTAPAGFFLSKERYALGFVVAVIPAALVAIVWPAILVGFLRSEWAGLPSGWAASPAWLAAFFVAQIPFVALARSRTVLRGGEFLRYAFAWAWPVAAWALVVFGLFPSTLRP
jgi:hypothetical protein